MYGIEFMRLLAKEKPMKDGPITGRGHMRDLYVLCKALAYAIETIEKLPPRWQEWSDKEDMKLLLDHMTSNPGIGLTSEYYHLIARSHIEHRPINMNDGNMTLGPRETADVVPLKPKGK
jgi:hypothetical protein